MAPKVGKRIVRALDEALLERDRTELRAVDALLTVIAPPRRRPTKTRRRHPATRRRA